MTDPEVTAASTATPLVRSSRFRRRSREASLGYLLLLPALFVFGVFIFYPFFKNFQLATHRTPLFGTGSGENVGLDQFGDVLGSKEFWKSLWTTVLFALLTVPAGIILGILLANLAHQKMKGIGFFRTVFSSTIATSVAVAAVIFGTLLSPVSGLLENIGIDPHPPYLQDPHKIFGVIPVALLAVAVITIWQNLGLSFILMSAGLQAVPDELLEAAEVDGASGWSRFRNVTIPLLSPTIFFAIVVGSIFAFQTFGQIDLLTPKGTPAAGQTNVLTYFIVSELHDSHNPGVAAVLAIALFVVTLLLTLLQMRFLERRVQYAR